MSAERREQVKELVEKVRVLQGEANVGGVGFREHPVQQRDGQAATLTTDPLRDSLTSDPAARLESVRIQIGQLQKDQRPLPL